MFGNVREALSDPAAIPAILLVLLVIAIYWTISGVASDKRAKGPRFSENKPLNALGWFGLLSLPFGVIVFLAVLWELLALAWSYPSLETAKENASDIRWHGSIMLAMLAALGALFTLLFAYIRVFTTERQTKAAERQATATEEALFNDKINSAADDLHARREIRRKKKMDDAEELGFIEDDIVRRVTAIDRLEALAQERPEEAPRIARLLCVYLRQLSKGIGPDHEEHPRADMEAAAQAIGRMKKIEGVDPDTVEIDLRMANLAGFDLRDLVFDDATLQDAEMIGADLRGASFRRANLQVCKLVKAQLNHADMTDAKLGYANLKRARLANARMQRAILSSVDLREVDLAETGLQGALLSSIDLDNGTGLQSARLRGSAMWMFDLTRAKHLTSLSLDEVFGDASVTLFGSPPAHWERGNLHWDHFAIMWRAWQEEIGFDPDDPATW
ncbi:pentapeptide repeat-containing protein [Sedimentitalea sp. JM2-8]|uniref:Pentapeptide repeat-containing protein n=1 Tax=Sedimentitalea xiamensis TaxID=3050037 RepID=A0ABT7FH69_9RHOB|nr:pentapeptide repeat-containing protein [Sedimentitalea xiamensis]MDK3074129.1 pentapeptide repeat-containing protein [Sedimentitalea xiamensis]